MLSLITGSVRSLGTYALELNSNDTKDIRSYNISNDIPYVEFLNDIDLNCAYYDEKSYVDSFSSSNNILIFSLNICSLQSKYTPLINLIDNFALNNAKPDIIMLQETFIKDIFYYSIKGYRAIFNCRPLGSRGGGTTIYCSELYNIKQLTNDAFFIPNILEATVMQVDIPGKSKFLIISVYRPNTHPNKNNQEQINDFFTALGTFLQIIDNYNTQTFIGGDFNLNLFDLHNLNSNSCTFLDIFASFGFINCISKATRIVNQSSTALDQIFLNDISLLCRSGVLIDSPSDHFGTFCEITLTKPIIIKDSFRNSRCFGNDNLLRFKAALLNQSWLTITDSNCTNTAFNNFFNIFFDIYNICFPISRIKINKKYHRINNFMTKGLLISRVKNLKLAQIAKKSPSIENKDAYRVYRGVYNNLIRRSKLLHHNRRVREAGNNSRLLWAAIKDAINLPKKNNLIGPILNTDTSTLLHDDVLKANYFNTYFSNIGTKTAEFIPSSNYSFKDFLNPPCPISMFLDPIEVETFANFVLGIKPKLSTDINGLSMCFIRSIIHEIKIPLTHIFNTSISNGIFPTQLKTSKCIPIFKKGDKTLADNYRLVSLVDNFSKPFEKIMCSRLINFLDETNFFLDSQFGFRKRLSTKHAILTIINYISKNINDNKYVLLIALDVMKAFDSCDHQILFYKLENAGIRGIVLDWFKSYFEGRQQRVFLNNVYSNILCMITLGVLQGSILGVILFLIIINDINLACPDLFSVIFADDDSLLVEDDSLEGVVDKANVALEGLVNWYSSNKFAIHPNKSTCMLFHKSNRSVTPPIFLDLPVIINLNNHDENFPNKISRIKSIPNVDEFSIKILGINIDNKLNFKAHVDYVHSKISRSLYSLKQMKYLLDNRHLKLLFSAYIKSHVDYADIFYCLCNKQTLQPLELIYKKAIRILSGKSYLEHTLPLFILNKILPIKENATLNILKLMYRCDKGKLPNCTKDFWRRNIDVSGRESRNENKFYQEAINFKFLENHPYFYFPKLYNDLLDDFKLASNEKEFANKVKSHLFDSLV